MIFLGTSLDILSMKKTRAFTVLECTRTATSIKGTKGLNLYVSILLVCMTYYGQSIITTDL